MPPMQVAVRRLRDVKDGADLEASLCDLMRAGSATGRGLRTFVLNLEGTSAPASRRAGLAWDAVPTGIDGVEIISCRASRGSVPECDMYLDRRAGRFALAHVGDEGGVADAAVDLLALTTQASRAWVCPRVIEGLAGGRAGSAGAGSMRVRRTARDGEAAAEVRCDGALVSEGGEAIRAHLRLADEVRAAHARMCANAEELRLGFTDTPHGPHFNGTTISLILSREISDVPGFVDEILDGSPPLRMLGGKTRVGEGHYMVPISDIENGIFMGSDFYPGRIGVSLHPQSSGTALLRLIAHMQVRYDPLLACPQVTTGVPGG